MTGRGTGPQGQAWLLRTVTDGQASVRERVVLAPPARVTITRLDGEQQGDIHLLLGDSPGGAMLGLQFDLVWHGIAEGSPLAQILCQHLQDQLLAGLHDVMAEPRHDTA